MATTTTNYGLSKPAYADAADVAVLNSNMDIVDRELKSVSDTAAQNATNIAALQQSVGDLRESVYDVAEPPSWNAVPATPLTEGRWS